MSDLSSPVVLHRPDPLLSTTTPLSDPAGTTIPPFSSSSPVQAVAFIDAALPDYQTLGNGVQPGTAVYLLNPNGNELNQISQVLAGYSNLASVQIFSHGSEGALQLGTTSLNTSNLIDYAGVLQSWAGSFSADGDLLLMGCDLAADAIGQNFVSQIAALTGADVAASTDLTGHHSLGGDWELEFATGSIEASGFSSRPTSSGGFRARTGQPSRWRWGQGQAASPGYPLHRRSPPYWDSRPHHGQSLSSRHRSALSPVWTWQNSVHRIADLRHGWLSVHNCGY